MIRSNVVLPYKLRKWYGLMLYSPIRLKSGEISNRVLRIIFRIGFGWNFYLVKHKLIKFWSQWVTFNGRPHSRDRLILFHWLGPCLTYIFQAEISKIYTWNIWGNFRNVSLDQISINNGFISWPRFSYTWSKFFRRENRTVQKSRIPKMKISAKANAT